MYPYIASQMGCQSTLQWLVVWPLCQLNDQNGWPEKDWHIRLFEIAFCLGDRLNRDAVVHEPAAL